MARRYKEIIDGPLIYFEALYGKPCWGVKKGFGSSLTFEFGEPNLEVEESHTSTWNLGTENTKKKLKSRMVRVRGDWHLWIDCCHWILELPGVSRTFDNSADRQIEEAVRILDGQKLTSVSIDRALRTTTFEFDLGGVLKTEPYQQLDSDGEPYESWILFLPDGNVVGYRADGTYHHHPAKQPCEEVEWIAF